MINIDINDFCHHNELRQLCEICPLEMKNVFLESELAAMRSRLAKYELEDDGEPVDEGFWLQESFRFNSSSFSAYMLSNIDKSQFVRVMAVTGGWFRDCWTRGQVRNLLSALRGGDGE